MYETETPEQLLDLNIDNAKEFLIISKILFIASVIPIFMFLNNMEPNSFILSFCYTTFSLMLFIVAKINLKSNIKIKNTFLKTK